MARILFLENREKTWFWAGIARLLQEQGHEIAWIVQNPVFGRNLPGAVHGIPLPRAADLSGEADEQSFAALVTDRGREHFGAGSRHYAYYAAHIERLLGSIAPDLVIGEPTLFHELLAVDLCRKLDIVFAHPVGERYPPHRFTIFDGDTQRPLIQTGDAMPDAEARDMAERIRDGRSIPTYMIMGGRLARAGRRLLWGRTRLRVVVGRVLGERFNTPSISTKRRLNRMARRNLDRWAKAARLPRDPARTILYPLQQQPENTIDVWGRPDFDQVRIVERILAATPEDVRVALKANPKPYYELSDALLAFAIDHPRIDLLPVDMRMGEALGHATGAITITGTVGYEAVFGRGRCLSISHPILADDFAPFAAPSVEAAAKRLLEDPEAGKGSAELGAALLQRLMARSFPGVIADPINDPASMTPANIGKVAHGIAALVQALPEIRSRRREPAARTA